MPGGLRDVQQRFGADAADYIAEVQKIIRANREVLDSIRQIQTVKIDADISGFMAKMAAAKAELGSLHDKTVTVTVKYVTVGDKPGAGSGLGADHSEIVRHLKDISTYMDIATDSMGQMEDHLLSIKRDAADSSAALAAQTQVLRANADAHNAAATAVTALAAATGRARAGGGAGIVGGGGGGGGGAGGAAAGAAAGGIAGRIFGGALPAVQGVHMVTMLTMEVASQLIPAAVAAGAAAAVGYQGGTAAVQRGQGIYAAGEAFGGAYGKTPGQLFGMSPGYQVAQNQATGGVYGIIGSLMQMAGQGTGQGGILGPGGMGVQTVAMIDRGLANMVLHNRMGAVSQALAGGTGALRTVGDIAGNLGATALNLAPVLPGMGGVLFGGLKGATGALRSVTSLAGGGGLWPLAFGTGLAAEAGFRWGGPILGGGKLPWFLGGGQFGGAAGLAERMGMGATGAAAGTEASGLAGLLAEGVGGLPIAGIAALAAASAYGISQGTFGSPASNQMSSYMGGINSSFGAGSLTPITQALFHAGLTQGHLPGVGYETIGGKQVPTGMQVADLVRQGYARPQALAEIQRQWAANTQSAADQLGKMAAAGPAGVKALSDLGVKGATMAQAFDYMSMAMISPKDVGAGGKLDATAMQQMKSFIKTYSIMTGGPQTSASALLSAGGADYVMATPQMKSLSQVNQALDSMTQIMTGGAANASALYQAGAAAPASVAQAIAGAAPRGSLTAGHRLVANALAQGPFTTAGAAAWQAFTNPQTGIIPASQANMDQLRTFMTMGGISGPQAGQLGAFELQQSVMPYASQSPMALAMLQQQAMQAGVPGVRMGQSYAQTQKAINAHAGTMQQANQIMTQGTRAAANIPAVADFLNPTANVSPLQSALYAQMAQTAMTAAMHPSKANVSALTSAAAMGGVKPGQMTVGVDAILKNLHVPQGTVAKINAEIGTVSMGAAAKKAMADLQTFAPSAELPGGTAGKATVKYKSTVEPPHPPAAHATVTYVPRFAAAHPPVLSGTVVYSPVFTGHGGIGTIAGGRAAQTGMLVPDRGSFGDVNPALLERGELVVPRNLVQAGAVDHLRGRIPGFQSGGLIGLNPTQGGMVTAAILNENFRALQQEIAALARSGGSFSTGGALPMPAAAQQVIDAFEKTFKSMSNPWGQFATTVLQSLLDSVKNPAKETAAQAKALTSRVTQEVNYAKSVSATAVSDLNLPGMQVASPTRTSMGTPYQYYADQATIAGGGSVSVQGQMGDYLQAIKSFGGDIKTLGKQGLNKAMLQQLLGAGPIQGDAMAQSILSGPGGAKEANKLWNQINKAANQLGITGAEAVYGVPKSKAVSAKADVTGTGAVHALQTAINTLQGKTVVVKVVLDIESAGGGGGGGGGGKGNVPLTNQVEHALQSHLSGGAAARHIQTATLKQAKRTGTSGLRLPGYAN